MNPIFKVTKPSNFYEKLENEFFKVEKTKKVPSNLKLTTGNADLFSNDERNFLQKLIDEKLKKYTEKKKKVVKVKRKSDTERYVSDSFAKKSSKKQSVKSQPKGPKSINSRDLSLTKALSNHSMSKSNAYTSRSF
jgi:hypothetical protein